ncbi:MAG TPA: hypothetical protein VMY87_06115 [Armatimonadota bacterium]|nr:hypothetical protein [Armatimonadota bacterium]
MAGIGVANLVITDKRSDGHIESHAWGLDFPLANLDRTRRTPGPLQSQAYEIPEWSLTNMQAIPELNAAILACHAGATDMVLSGWTQEVSSYWKEIKPPGRYHKWLKWYDGRPDQAASLLYKTALPKYPTWRFMFLRAQPPEAQTQPVDIAITLNAMGTIQYQLYLPQLWYEDLGGSQPDTYFPSLWKSVDAGATWTCVDEFMREEASRWLSQAFGRIEYIYCRFVPDHLLFSLGNSEALWCYHEPELDIPQGHVRIEAHGGQTAFHFKLSKYLPDGSLERNIRITPPEFLSAETDTLRYLGSPGLSGGIAVSMQSEDDQLWPKADLISSGGNYWTPIIYEIQATRPATHAEPIATVLFDNIEVPADKRILEDVEFMIASGWRGSHFTARLRTAGEYAFTGNEKAQLAVALDTGGELEYVNQMTGYLDCPKRAIDPRDPGAIILDLTARDRLCRLQNKAARLLPSFAGWSFADAWLWLLHECAGLPETDILLDDDAADYIYPCPLSSLPLKFDSTANLVDVADQLAQAANREWGVNPDGNIFTRIRGGPVYSGEPDWTLDQDTVTEADTVYLVQLERDIFSLRNHVLVLGQDRDGNDVCASWRHLPSVINPDYDPFIGDDWWEVKIAPDGCDPWSIAAYSGTELLSYRALLIWETDGKPALFPDHFVEVYADGLDIPAGTVFRITDKWGRLDARTTQFTTRFGGIIL